MLASFGCEQALAGWTRAEAKRVREAPFGAHACATHGASAGHSQGQKWLLALQQFGSNELEPHAARPHPDGPQVCEPQP